MMLHASMLAPALVVLAAIAGPDSARAEVHPAPQSATSRPEVVTVPQVVTLVSGAGTDASARAVARAALRLAGARTIEEVDDRDTAERDGLTVYVGGRTENAATAGALRALEVK